MDDFSSTQPKGSSSSFVKPFKRTSFSCFFVILVSVGFVVGGMYLANYISSFWVETFEIAGDATHFDPMAAIQEIRSHFDANAQLNSLRLQYVRSDGTMDLKADYKPNASYSFYSELSQSPKNAPPIGAGGTNGKWYEPVEVNVYEPGQWRHVENGTSEYNYMNKGIELNRSAAIGSPVTFIDDPHCSLTDFWKIAIQKGAPLDAVSTVIYDENGYSFRIRDTAIDMQFSQNCQLKP